MSVTIDHFDAVYSYLTLLIAPRLVQDLLSSLSSGLSCCPPAPLLYYPMHETLSASPWVSERTRQRAQLTVSAQQYLTQQYPKHNSTQHIRLVWQSYKSRTILECSSTEGNTAEKWCEVTVVVVVNSTVGISKWQEEIKAVPIKRNVSP